MSTNAPRREPWIVPLLAHWSPAMFVATAVLALVPWGTGPTSWLIVTVWNGAYLATMIAEAIHNYRYLCHRCAASTPLDGAAEAQRRHRSLNFLHAIADRRWLSMTLGIGFLVMIISPAPLVLVFGPQPWYVVCTALPLAWFGIQSFLLLRHRPVQPWCPKCHWDDGGDDEESPIVPEPVAPSGDR